MTFSERVAVDRKQLLRSMVAFFSLLKEKKIPYPQLYSSAYRKVEEVSDVELLSLLKETSQVLSELVEVSVPQFAKLVEKAVKQLEKIEAFQKQVDFLNWELFRDSLTGLWNREALSYFFNKEVKPKVLDSPVVLAFVDLNDFKQVNDNFGHIEGDRYLKAFADFLRSSFSDEFVARYGGDEFIVLTQNLLIPAVKKKFAYLLENSPEFKGKRISFAVGITNVVGADSLESAISRADMGMYRSKISGTVEYIRR